MKISVSRGIMVDALRWRAPCSHAHGG